MAALCHQVLSAIHQLPADASRLMLWMHCDIGQGRTVREDGGGCRGAAPLQEEVSGRYAIKPGDQVNGIAPPLLLQSLLVGAGHPLRHRLLD